MSDLYDHRQRPASRATSGNTAAQVEAARRACARAAVARYPGVGDPRAVGELALLLSALGIGGDDGR